MTHNSADAQNLSEFAVRLHNFRATDVLGLDKSGTSDPYLKVNFDNHTRFHTKFIKQERNPVWGLDKSFIYETAYPKREHLMMKTLRIKCADHEKVHKARLIGIAKVDLYTLATGPVLHDIPLLDEFDNECGRVQFACEFIDMADVTVVLKDVLLSHIPHRVGSSRPYLRITDEKMLGLPLDTPIYTENTESAKWDGPHAFMFKASLPHMLENAIRVSVMDKRPIDVGEKESHSDHLAEFKIRVAKYYDFEVLKATEFSQTARKPKEPNDRWPHPNVDATLSGTLFFSRVATYCQMPQGLHTEKGITDAAVFSRKCPMPNCDIQFTKKKPDDSSKPASSSSSSSSRPMPSQAGYPQSGVVQPGYPTMPGQNSYEHKAGATEYDVDDDSDDDGNGENSDAQLARMTAQQLQINRQNVQAQQPHMVGQNPAFQRANLNIPAMYNPHLMQPSPTNSNSPHLSPRGSSLGGMNPNFVQPSNNMGRGMGMGGNSMGSSMGAPPMGGGMGLGMGIGNPMGMGGMNPGYNGGMSGPAMGASGMSGPGGMGAPNMGAPGMSPNYVQPNQPNAGGVSGYNSNVPLPKLNPGYAAPAYAPSGVNPPNFSASGGAPQSMPVLNPGYASPGYTAASSTMPALNPGYAPATAPTPQTQPSLNPHYHPSPSPTQQPYGGSSMAARTGNYGGRTPSGSGGSGPLPAGWSAGEAPDGRTYYKNDVTRSTTWTRPTAPAVAPLPAGWSEAKTPDGRTYYKNDVLKTTAWERPTKPAVASQPQRSPNNVNSAPLPYGWSQHADGNGRTYYKNHLTHSTSWERPTGTASQQPAYSAQPNYTAQPRGGYPGQRGY